MDKNTKTVWLAGMALVVVLAAGYWFWDRSYGGGSLDCGDGPRQTIDMRNFETKYWAYSLELEASVADKAKVSTKFTPQQLQQISEASQNAADFRKYVVAGYNGCAITKEQYQHWEPQFQTIDRLAKEINQLAAAPSLTDDQKVQLAKLISEYGDLVGRLAAK